MISRLIEAGAITYRARESHHAPRKLRARSMRFSDSAAQFPPLSRGGAWAHFSEQRLVNGSTKKYNGRPRAWDDLCLRKMFNRRSIFYADATVHTFSIFYFMHVKYKASLIREIISIVFVFSRERQKSRFCRPPFVRESESGRVLREQVKYFPFFRCDWESKYKLR